MTTFGRMVLVLSAGFLLAGIVVPEAAELLLRIFLLSLAGAFVATRARDAELPTRTTRDAYSPFTREDAARTPPEAPLAVRRRASLLEAADDPGRARRTPVPVPVKWAVLDEVSHRLAERRGLDLNDPQHHPRVRSVVREDTWRLIRPLGGTADDSGSPEPAPAPVTLDRLPSILDDMERL